MSDQRRQALLTEYGEVANNFRLLTGIRFKLLTLLPAGTILTVVLTRDLASGGAFVIALFGLATTIALVTYNARNDQLYDELVGRAASIERSLGLPDGAFANRSGPWLTIRLFDYEWTVDHRASVSLIYTASIILWLFLFINTAVVNLTGVDDAVVWSISLVLASGITGVTAGSVVSQNCERRRKMRVLAKRAVDLVKSPGLARIGGEADGLVDLVDVCAKLSGLDPKIVRARACFYARTDPEITTFYLQASSKERAAAQFVALLTDLPPGWLLDCATNRRGNLGI
jgi:hypothetical protein